MIQNVAIAIDALLVCVPAYQRGTNRTGNIISIYCSKNFCFPMIGIITIAGTLMNNEKPIWKSIESTHRRCPIQYRKSMKTVVFQTKI